MDTNVQLTILALVAVGALALVLQTIFLIVLAGALRKGMRSLREELGEYRSSIVPVISSIESVATRTRDLADRLAPKIEDAADELVEITRSLRMQTADIQRAADDIIARTQRQAGRVDGMLTTVFDGVERAGSFVADTVQKPMRQLTGVIASVKAMVDTLRAPETPHRAYPASRYPGGEDLR
ncbi:MAG: DUF948 domain-containing protein [Acidobacteriota bacterium]